MYRIAEVEYLDGYRLRLFFTNKEVRIINLSNHLKKAQNMFLDLVNIDCFKKVHCDGYSIVWPNGIDYCPDWLHMYSSPEASLEKKIQKRLSI